MEIAATLPATNAFYEPVRVRIRWFGGHEEAEYQVLKEIAIAWSDALLGFVRVIGEERLGPIDISIISQ